MNKKSSILLSSIILLLILFPFKTSAHEVGIEQTANTDLLYENKEITDFNVLYHNAKNNIDVVDSSQLETDFLIHKDIFISAIKDLGIVTLNTRT